MKHLLRSAARSIAAFIAAVAPFPTAAQIFAPPVILPVNIYYGSPYGIHIALADFNNDGFLDLIVAYPGQVGGTVPKGSGGAQIYAGDGKGGFATPQFGYSLTQSFDYPGTSDGPLYLTLGDFNNDGRLDVICPLSGGIELGPGSSYGVPVSGTTIGVVFGGATGTYNQPRYYAVGDTPTAALVGDFNHDNIPDVAITNASGILTVYLGTGGGLYQGGAVYRVGGNPKAIRVGDFNRDGRPDLATVNASDNSLSLLMNNGDGTFQKAKRLVMGANLQDAALADLNGNGRTDIVTLRSSRYPSLGEVDVFLNQPDGTFSLSKTYPVSNTATALLLADFSGTGLLDALTNDGVMTHGIGSAGNTALLTYSGNLAVGDVNRDGNLDYVIGNQLYINIGPTFSLQVSLTLEAVPPGNTSDVVTMDFRNTGGGQSFQRTERVYGNGTFQYTRLPAGDYTVHISGFHFLGVNVPIHGATNGSAAFSATLPTGDTNGDNSVDSTDFGIFIGAYGGMQYIFSTNYNYYADFNRDGSVDSTDFGLLIGNFGRQGDP